MEHRSNEHCQGYYLVVLTGWLNQGVLGKKITVRKGRFHFIEKCKLLQPCAYVPDYLACLCLVTVLILAISTEVTRGRSNMKPNQFGKCKKKPVIRKSLKLDMHPGLFQQGRID